MLPTNIRPHISSSSAVHVSTLLNCPPRLEINCLHFRTNRERWGRGLIFSVWRGGGHFPSIYLYDSRPDESELRLLVQASRGSSRQWHLSTNRGQDWWADEWLPWLLQPCNDGLAGLTGIRVELPLWPERRMRSSFSLTRNVLGWAWLFLVIISTVLTVSYKIRSEVKYISSPAWRCQNWCGF